MFAATCHGTTWRAKYLTLCRSSNNCKFCKLPHPGWQSSYLQSFDNNFMMRKMRTQHPWRLLYHNLFIYWMWRCGSTGSWDSTGYLDQFLLHFRASQTYNTCMYSTHQYLTYKMSLLIMTSSNLMINVCDNDLILCLCELQWLAVQWSFGAHTTLTVLEPFPPISVSVWHRLWVVTS